MTNDDPKPGSSRWWQRQMTNTFPRAPNPKDVPVAKLREKSLWERIRAALNGGGE